MRCMNCGWENPDNLQKCEKCNSPLQPHVPQEMPSHSIPENVELRRTVSEQQVFSSPSGTDREDNTCPQCGYPIREGMHHCPNCGAEIGGRVGQVVKEAPKVGHMRNATVNPWANPNAGKTFTLEAIAWEGEQSEPIIHSYTGEHVELNRDNTDPTNNTITSKVQAEISCENGVWSLLDKSSQTTTFVQAKRKVDLQDGDVIMLGNRKFIFKIK